MGKVIIHTHPDLEAIEERRLMENLLLSPNERMKRAFELMSLSILFSKNKILKSPQGLGTILKK
jgi:hypothetical protein